MGELHQKLDTDWLYIDKGLEMIIPSGAPRRLNRFIFDNTYGHKETPTGLKMIIQYAQKYTRLQGLLAQGPLFRPKFVSYTGYMDNAPTLSR